ncbi:transmembrane 9 superfamily member 2-like [Lingula anatina]|uniref:Transmembrane 9 superfamily member n=1 Tax=Lingula anatina TaxID=7574 RepID=A0A2R2MMF6_LINAN|nr:transmembrane 9 superfamily member 2-like [Lingula anatina]|eukprot:XP_023931384.1 transmembrane 9 superfamily member 2-like [Lingula anatina]
MKFFAPLALLWHISAAFYLPGLAPVNYCEKVDAEQSTCQVEIPVMVNRLDSVENIIPYEYDAFDFCSSESGSRQTENLGQVVFGERITNSPYKFTFKQNEKCKEVCVKKYPKGAKDNKSKLDMLRKGIKQNYQHHW